MNGGDHIYIKKIDSLRAISVCAVIIFHYFPDLMPAGFLGVDIFFVISGFVITASLIAYEPQKSLQGFCAKFYLRRIKRLMPALLFVVLVSSILLVLFGSDTKDSLRSGALSLIGATNFYLYFKSFDYFALSTELNAFTHVWSLAVEDQYYLIYPLILWAVGFKGQPERCTMNKVLNVITALCVVSFLLYIAVSTFDPSFAFYMLPTRFWQIGLGATAFLMLKADRSLFGIEKFSSTPALVAILLLLYFGGDAKIIATSIIGLLVMIFLMQVSNEQHKNSFLENPLLTYIGRLSYSLYLWHWPILVLAKQTIGISDLTIVICLLLSFTMATFSYHVVETPMRYAKLDLLGNTDVMRFNKLLWVPVLCTVILFGLSSSLSKSKTNLLTYMYDFKTPPPAFQHKCSSSKRLKNYKTPLDECLKPKRTAAKPHAIFLIGDSHANQYIPMFKKTLAELPYALHYINMESDQAGILSLTRQNKHVATDIAYVLNEAQEGDIFILTFHRGRLNPSRDKHLALDDKLSMNEVSQNFIHNMERIIPQLNKKRVKIVLIHDTPLLAMNGAVSVCALQHKIMGKSQCSVDEQQDLKTRGRQDKVYQILISKFNDVYSWDPALAIYDHSQIFDAIDELGFYNMIDSNHISPQQSFKLQPSFTSTISRIISK